MWNKNVLLICLLGISQPIGTEWTSWEQRNLQNIYQVLCHMNGQINMDEGLEGTLETSCLAKLVDAVTVGLYVPPSNSYVEILAPSTSDVTLSRRGLPLWMYLRRDDTGVGWAPPIQMTLVLIKKGAFGPRPLPGRTPCEHEDKDQGDNLRSGDEPMNTEDYQQMTRS